MPGPLKRRAFLVPVDVQRSLERGSRSFLAVRINDYNVAEAAPLQLPRLLHRLLIRPACEGHGLAGRIGPLDDKHNTLSPFHRGMGARGRWSVPAASATSNARAAAGLGAS